MINLLIIVSVSFSWGIHASQTTQIRIVKVINHPHVKNYRIEYLRKNGVLLVFEQRIL